MMEQKGYYSLVQFLPDLTRQEGVNIGVVLYLAETHKADVRVLTSNSKIKQFFGKQDWEFVSYLKNSLVQRLQRDFFSTRAELQNFIEKRANRLQMTTLQPITVSDPGRDIDRLFDELVVSSPLPRRKRIDTYLGQALGEAGVRGLVQQSVHVRFPHFDSPLRAPYGYQNGRFNLLSPIQFGSDLREVIAKVGEKAVEGQVLFENPDPQYGSLCLNVIAKFPDELSGDSRLLVESVLRSHQVKLYNFENLEPLLKDIRQAAADHLAD